MDKNRKGRSAADAAASATGLAAGRELALQGALIFLPEGIAADTAVENFPGEDFVLSPLAGNKEGGIETDLPASGIEVLAGGEQGEGAAGAAVAAGEEGLQGGSAQRFADEVEYSAAGRRQRADA